MSDDLDPTPAERQMIEAAKVGGIADLQPTEIAENEPTTGADWSLERTVRAAIIYALAVGSNPDWPIHARGVRLRGAKIVGTLDFEAAELLHPLALLNCYVEDPIIFNGASAHSIYLTGSQVFGINARGLHTRYNVCLNDGFTAKGDVALYDAHIGGLLQCGGATFNSSTGRALSADRLSVEGSIFLRNGFKATGEVRLLGAEIGGDFDCHDGIFENLDGDALSADGLIVARDIILSRSFKAKGTVRLLGAKIGGDLNCAGGNFENPDRGALIADRAEIGGSAFLGDGFNATGEIRLLGVKIGSNFDCVRGTFDNTNGIALNGERIIVEGSALLNSGFRATGEVRLLGAKITGNLRCYGATFENSGKVSLDLEGATVGRTLSLNALTKAPSGKIDLSFARVGRLDDEPSSWPNPGSLILQGFVYEGLGGPTDAKTRREWLKRQPKGQFRPQPYEQLVRVLREMGHDRDAQAIAIGKQVALRKTGDLGVFQRCWSWLLAITVRYGYQPMLIVLWMAAFIALGGWVFSQAYSSCLMAPSKEGIYLNQNYQCANATWTLPSQYPRFHAIVYSLDAFFPVVDLQQKTYWQPNDTSPIGLAYRVYFWFHTVMGWLFTALAVAGLTRVVKRD